MSEQSHRSDPRLLNRRSLEVDHRRLAGMLRPGMSVLDVGCGTGAITAGIAKAVGPAGSVVGVDRDESLLAVARQEHGKVGNLRFEQGDALSLPFEHSFDVVTAARTLQWVSRPEKALLEMKKAARSGGQIIVLDYNHEANTWEPDPPAEFRRFYEAFLQWRAANDWDNRMFCSRPGDWPDPHGVSIGGKGGIDTVRDSRSLLMWNVGPRLSGVAASGALRSVRGRR